MTLRAPFNERETYASSGNYRLLPFRFTALDAGRYVLTNDVGEFEILDAEDLRAFVGKTLSPAHPRYRALKSKHLLLDDTSSVALNLLALKYRTRAEQLASFTGLHMFVVTLRCDHSCHYCQVSRQTEDRTAFDMSIEHANLALDFVFRSPSPALKIEFQGGEPLLNFPLIRHVVLRAEEMNRHHRRALQFVIASNLSRLDEDVLAFCKDHEIYFSTSLDGPEDLHNANRPLRGGNGYQATLVGIERIREALGVDRVAALMTTTPASLTRIEEIIDEYARRGFRSIFLRSLSPYGFAVRTSLVRRYDAASWIDFYKRGLRHILWLNENGYAMREELAGILLHKMFSPSGSGYVDLQSPAGLGIGAIVYNYDGAVYASDEGRMVAEMGDQTFRLGRLGEQTYEEMMTSEQFVGLLEDTILESAPQCSDCAFLPYCGADPVFHKATQGDVLGHKAFSAFCSKQMGVLRHLISLLEDEPAAREVLMDWADI
jgi:His-Xaa-Ser system radical SAM maturase HxsB